MRTRGILLFVCLFLTIVLVAIGSDTHDESYQRTFTVLDMQADYIELNLTLPNYETETYLERGLEYKKIEFENSSYFLDEGKPELPYFSSLLAIPFGGDIESVEIIGYDKSYLSDFRAYPAQDYTNEIDRTFSLDNDYYHSGKIYPFEDYAIGSPAIMRDFNLCNISVAPFFFNPQNNTLEIRDNIRVRVNYSGSYSEIQPRGRYASSFESIYEAYVDNFNNLRDDLVRDYNQRVLIIYGNSSDNTFLAKLDEFADWKRKRGFIVDAFSTSSAGTNTTAIKNFIQNRYDNINQRPDYLVLVGDTSGAFSLPTYTENLSGYSGCGDNPYTQLAGNDVLGDVHMGRISVENSTQFSTMINKVFYYERDMTLQQTNWYNKMLLVGDTAPSGQSCVYVNKYIKAESQRINPDYTFTEIYSDNPSTSLMDNAISQGVGVYNYRGYIGMSGWSPSASALNNGDRLCHSTILTCSTGTFSGTSPTESFTRLGSPTLPKGALTAIGMATSGTHTIFNNALATGIWNGILNYGARDLGKGLTAGKLNLYAMYWGRYNNQVDYFSHWCNLMGDPTVTMYLQIPETFNANYSTSIPSGTQYIPVTALDAEGVPVSDAIVTAFQSNSLHVIARTDESGNALLLIPSDATGSIAITVTKDEFKSHMGIVQVSSAGGVVYAEHTVLDAVTGNNDGIANGGETISLNLALTNTTSSSVDNTIATLSTNDQYATIIQSSVDYGTIASQNNSTGNSSFEMTFSSSIPDAYMVLLNLSVNSSLGSFDSVFEVSVHNSDIDIVDLQINDSGNGVLDPGDTANLILTVQNDGAQ
ncbi:MAG: C25 family cysteine peptidase, partial [Candidatus Zophobacter franzmannii]|nr:C25 family cysteine peptidase [Candidatus Zophobacter franzmannii]